jgi:hypothetical protein
MESGTGVRHRSVCHCLVEGNAMYLDEICNVLQAKPLSYLEFGGVFRE